MKKIAVFASGSGSNYEALMSYMHESPAKENIDVALVVSDKPAAYVMERAQKWGTPTFAVSVKDFENKMAYEESILAQLQAHDIDFIVLAGYMRLLGPTLLKAYMGRIVNIHPSLLPAFPGKDAIGQALDYGVRLTGVTIHFVDEGMDTGPIIFQKAIDITEHETRDSLTKKIQQVEHTYYPKIILSCVNGEIKMEERKVKWV